MVLDNSLIVSSFDPGLYLYLNLSVHAIVR